MSSSLPPEIKKGLVSLRRRIRRIQTFRGLLRTASVMLGGLLLIVGLDYFLAPLPSLVRAGLFFLWLAGIAAAVGIFLLRPLFTKIPLVRLARWLENRHPEVEERISTALELSDHPEGISPELLEELSKEAALDISMVDPQEEVQSKRVRRSLWPAAAALVALISLLAVWPREMGRLLTRAVSPFSELGNAGAFRFVINPGNAELLEGDIFQINLTYTGSLEKPLELLIERDGEVFSESLQPSSSSDKTHQYSYQVNAAEADFKYSARVAASESDRFEVKVFPLPRLLEPMVTLQYPPYTGWSDREMSLGNGVQALAGTEVTLKGRFETPLESGELIFDEEAFGEVSLEANARGTDFVWSEMLKPGLEGPATVKVKHRLGRTLNGAKFQLKATEDPAPVVKILTPVQREFRVKPDEQVIITYEVNEMIGLSKAEIQLEVNGRLVEPLLELLPERIDFEGGRLWEGEAMVFLGSLMPQHKGAREFRMRLALSDNRPAELDGPGVGYSEWLEFKLDRNAESLVRQELREQDSDLRQTIEKAVRDIHEARNKMQEAKSEMNREEVSERAEKAIAKSREKLKEAQKDLNELSERMKQGVHEHRRDEIESAVANLEEAKESVESTALQDTPEGRQSEMENALRESEEALNDLQELKNEVQKDQPKVEDLARLQEMAQRQEELARQAAEKEPDDKWKNEQRQMREEIRQKVQQSPEAKAAAMASQSQRAMDLSKEAEALAEAQDQLADLSEKAAPAEPKRNEQQLKQAIAEEQQKVVKEARKELADAKRGKEERANDLPKAIEEAKQAMNEANQNKPQEAAVAAKEAAAELAKGADESPSQKSLQEKQEKLAEAFDALAEGKTEEARAALEEAQNVQHPDEVAKALAKAQEEIVKGAKGEMVEAQKGEEGRAESLPKAIEEAQAALNEAKKADAQGAAESASKASEELAKGAENSPSQQSLQKQQEAIAEAFEALAEGKTEEAFDALEAMQAERLNDALSEAIAREQEAVVEGVKAELGEARMAQEARANNLPEAVAQAEAALEGAQQGDPQAAAQSAQQAARELSKGAEVSPSQHALQEKQTEIAEALQDLAEGRPAEALAALEEMQAERAAELSQSIQDIAPVEGNPMRQASQQAKEGAQRASEASNSQQAGQSSEASKQHQQSAQKFEQAQKSLERASQQLAKAAQKASEQPENSRTASAPGDAMAEALQQSSEAASSQNAQEAASKAQAAADALRKAADEAKSQMKQGRKPGEEMAQADEPGEPGEGEKPGQDAKEGMRQAQGDQGVPAELAKLGISATDWEKIQATMKTDVSGSRRAVIPEDYRGLVKKYFEQVSQKQ